jgi:hypothetical protein
MFRRALFAILATICLWFAGRAIVHALASDETKIRWKIEAACQGFDDTRMNPILDLLAKDYREETLGFSREDVRSAVASIFFSEKDPQTKRFPYRVELVAEDLVIEVEKPDAKRARVALHARILDTRDGAKRNAWEFRVTGTLEKYPDGWQLATSTQETVAGSFRLR